MGRSVTLPSGAVLYIDLAGFVQGRALYQAFLAEIKALKIEPGADLDADLAKNLVCITFASKAVEDAIWACMDRCTYKKTAITLETFEPAEARGDYFDVLMEVGRENIRPFMKGLLQKYGAILRAAWAEFLEIDAKEDELVYFLRLSKAGYGSLEYLSERASSRVVIQALYWEGFLQDYEAAWWDLNNKGDK